MVLDDLLSELIPDRELLLFGLVVIAFGYGLAVTSAPVPYLAVGGGLLCGGVLKLVYARTGLRRSGDGGDRSATDWVVLAVFCLGIGALVVYGQVETAGRPDLSLLQGLGFVAGAIAGDSSVECALGAAF